MGLTMAKKKKKKKQQRLSYCSETRSIRSSRCSSNCELPTCNCGEMAVIKVSWTRDNPRRRFHGCLKFIRQRNI